MGKLYNYFFGDKDSGASEAGGWIPGASNPAQERPRIRFVLTGTTGTGKTSTVLQLFGHNNDLEELGAKTSNCESETRETVEYVLKVKPKKAERAAGAKEVSLTLVDTPGLGDTYGNEQDARNLACVKRYMKGNQTEPNLVILTLKADDARYSGPQSGFSRCIEYYLKGDLGLTSDGTNVVVVLTHALNITHNKRKFGEESRKKMVAVQEMVYAKTGWRVPVVVLENKPPPGCKRGDWTILPDGTLQPKNLFDAVKQVFERRNDLPGKVLTEMYFSRSSRDSKVRVERGDSVAATLVSEAGPLSQEEEEYYDKLTPRMRGFPPAERQNAMERINNWRSASPSSRQDNSSSDNEEEEEKGSGTRSSHDAMEDNLDSISSISLTRHGNLDRRNLVGRCYDLSGEGTIKDAQIFKDTTLSGALRTEDHSRTVTGSLDNSNKNCIFKRKGGNGMFLSGVFGGSAHGSLGDKDAHDATDELEFKVIKVLVTKVVPSTEVKDVWDSQQYLCMAFAKDLEKLPTGYVSKLKAKYLKFFNKWGQGFIVTGYYGGEVRIRKKTDIEETLERSGASGSLNSGGSYSGTTSDRSSSSYFSSPSSATSSVTSPQIGLGGGASSAGSATTRNLDHQGDFRGGDPDLHHPEKIDAWKTSVSSRTRWPLEELVLDVSEDVLLHHDFIRNMGSWLNHASKKAKALEQAFIDIYVPTRKEVVEAEAPKNTGMLRRWFGMSH